MRYWAIIKLESVRFPQKQKQLHYTIGVFHFRVCFLEMTDFYRLTGNELLLGSHVATTNLGEVFLVGKKDNGQNRRVLRSMQPEWLQDQQSAAAPYGRTTTCRRVCGQVR